MKKYRANHLSTQSIDTIEKCKSKIQDESQQSYEIGNENGYKNGYQAGYDKREEEINGSTITFYIPSVLRAEASTMTMESTEIKITTAHAETMAETTTTYDMTLSRGGAAPSWCGQRRCLKLLG